MKDMFSMDSPLMGFLTKVADLMIVNILFIIFCIPIVTIGASFSAMYYVTLKLVKNEEGYVAKQFVKGFKDNFKQATIIWVVMLMVAAGLIYDGYVVVTGGSPETFKIVIIVLGVVWSILFINVFPIMAKFENTLLNTIKNSFVVGLTHLVKTVLMMVFTVAPIVFVYKKIEFFPVLLLLGFSVIAFVNSVWFNQIFDAMIDNYNKEPENPEILNDSEYDSIGVADSINKRIIENDKHE